MSVAWLPLAALEHWLEIRRYRVTWGQSKTTTDELAEQLAELESKLDALIEALDEAEGE